MSLVVLDTDVCSQLLRGRLPQFTKTSIRGHAWAVTFVTVGELTAWAEVRS